VASPRRTAIFEAVHERVLLEDAHLALHSGPITTGVATRSLYNALVPTVPTAVAPTRSENDR